MIKDIDVVGLGDLMIDFSFVGTNEQGVSLFARNPAGSMANVLCQVAKLGGKSVLITTLGNDSHSRYLYDTAVGLGMDMSCVTFGTLPTRFMFEYYDNNNDRYFDDYRSPRNEKETKIENIDTDKLKRSRFFDIKAIAFQADDSIVATELELFRMAASNEVTMAIDMQWRGIPLPEEDKRQIISRAGLCGVIKLTDEELEYYFDGDSLDAGVDTIFRNNLNARLVAVTMGARGCLLCTRKYRIHCSTYDVSVVDTTGAGDSFMGSLLLSLSENAEEIEKLSEKKLREIGDFCNACASFSTTRKGSLLSMGTREDALSVMRSYKKLN